LFDDENDNSKGIRIIEEKKNNREISKQDRDAYELLPGGDYWQFEATYDHIFNKNVN